MIGFLWNLALALVWVAATGRTDPAHFLLGFALGYLVLFFSQRAVGSRNYFRKVHRAVELLLYFLWELLQSNLRLAHDVMTPQLYMRPAIVAVPLEARTDAEITLLSNLISLTPGSFTVDVSADRSTLFVYAMYVDRGDVEAFRKRIRDGFERRVLEVLR